MHRGAWVAPSRDGQVADASRRGREATWRRPFETGPTHIPSFLQAGSASASPTSQIGAYCVCARAHAADCIYDLTLRPPPPEMRQSALRFMTENTDQASAIAFASALARERAAALRPACKCPRAEGEWRNPGSSCSPWTPLHCLRLTHWRARRQRRAAADTASDAPGADQSQSANLRPCAAQGRGRSRVRT